MEAKAIIPERPVVADVRVLVDDQVVDSKCLQASSDEQAPTQWRVLVSSPDLDFPAVNLRCMKDHSRISAADNENVGTQMFLSTLRQRLGRGSQEALILGIHVEAREPCGESPDLPVDWAAFGNLGE